MGQYRYEVNKSVDNTNRKTGHVSIMEPAYPVTIWFGDMKVAHILQTVDSEQIAKEICQTMNEAGKVV